MSNIRMTDTVRSVLILMYHTQRPMSAFDLAAATVGATGIGRITLILADMEGEGWAESDWGVAPAPDAARPRLVLPHQPGLGDCRAPGLMADDSIRRKEWWIVGWSSAYQIMDIALEAAETAVRAALMAEDVQPRDGDAEAAMQKLVDDALRPCVVTLAGLLHDGDWDTEQDSQFFDRFPQEMLGHTDREHLAWLIERVVDSEAAPEAVEKLTAFRARTGLIQ